MINEDERERNRKKLAVRSRVEHIIGVIKLKFGFTKVRYRGLEKNANRLFTTCGLTNLYILRHRFLTA
ncbi:MAG: transposase [Acidocella sp.]|nr:transposase [Acidocella sp.]